MADIIYEDYYGSVIRVDGTCYNFWKEVPDDLTQDPPPDDLFDTCEECSSSSLSEESLSSLSSLAPGIVVPCNDCDPPLAETYTVTLGGLIGTIWAGREGSHMLTHYGSGCTWISDPAGIALYWSAAGPSGAAWYLDVQNDSGARSGTIQYTGGTDPCAPLNDYGTHSGCQSIEPSDCTELGVTSAVVITEGEFTCNDCDPPLDQSYIVEVWLPEDYEGSFEPYRGDHTVSWTDSPGCTWVGGPGNNVKLFFGYDGWTIEVTPSATDRIHWIAVEGDRCSGPI
jgi:hypothetical protein